MFKKSISITVLISLGIVILVLVIAFLCYQRAEKDMEEISGLNIPGSWHFPPAGAPEGWLVFHEDGILEIPEWIGGEGEKTHLNWRYDQGEELLIINFGLIPNLFPENEQLAQSLFGNVEIPRRSLFVGYDKQESSISIKVTSETAALEFFGWIFSKVEDGITD